MLETVHPLHHSQTASLHRSALRACAVGEPCAVEARPPGVVGEAESLYVFCRGRVSKEPLLVKTGFDRSWPIHRYATNRFPEGRTHGLPLLLRQFYNDGTPSKLIFGRLYVLPTDEGSPGFKRVQFTCPASKIRAGKGYQFGQVATGNVQAPWELAFGEKPGAGADLLPFSDPGTGINLKIALDSAMESAEAAGWRHVLQVYENNAVLRIEASNRGIHRRTQWRYKGVGKNSLLGQCIFDALATGLNEGAIPLDLHGLDPGEPAQIANITSSINACCRLELRDDCVLTKSTVLAGFKKVDDSKVELDIFRVGGDKPLPVWEKMTNAENQMDPAKKAMAVAGLLDQAKRAVVERAQNGRFFNVDSSATLKQQRAAKEAITDDAAAADAVTKASNAATNARVAINAILPVVKSVVNAAIALAPTIQEWYAGWKEFDSFADDVSLLHDASTAAAEFEEIGDAEDEALKAVAVGAVEAAAVAVLAAVAANAAAAATSFIVSANADVHHFYDAAIEAAADADRSVAAASTAVNTQSLPAMGVLAASNSTHRSAFLTNAVDAVVDLFDQEIGSSTAASITASNAVINSVMYALTAIWAAVEAVREICPLGPENSSSSAARRAVSDLPRSDFFIPVCFVDFLQREARGSR